MLGTAESVADSAEEPYWEAASWADEAAGWADEAAAASADTGDAGAVHYVNSDGETQTAASARAVTKLAEWGEISDETLVWCACALRI